MFNGCCLLVCLLTVLFLDKQDSCISFAACFLQAHPLHRACLEISKHRQNTRNSDIKNCSIWRFNQRIFMAGKHRPQCLNPMAMLRKHCRCSCLSRHQKICLKTAKADCSGLVKTCNLGRRARWRVIFIINDQPLSRRCPLVKTKKCGLICSMYGKCLPTSTAPVLPKFICLFSVVFFIFMALVPASADLTP